MTEQIFILKNQGVTLKAIGEIKACFMNGDLSEVILRPFVSKRSTCQNRLYRKWVEVLSNEVGSSKDHMHEYLARKFLPETIERIFGSLVGARKSTSKLNVTDFTQYLRDIEGFANENGYLLPQPMVIYEISMGKKNG